MNINDKIKDKETALANAKTTEEKLWAAQCEADKRYREEFLNPWGKAQDERKKLEKELEILRGIAQEVAS